MTSITFVLVVLLLAVVACSPSAGSPTGALQPPEAPTVSTAGSASAGSSALGVVGPNFMAVQSKKEGKKMRKASREAMAQRGGLQNDATLPRCLFLHGTGRGHQYKGEEAEGRVIYEARVHKATVYPDGTAEEKPFDSMKAYDMVVGLWGHAVHNVADLCQPSFLMADNRRRFIKDPELQEEYCDAIERVQPQYLVAHSAANLVIAAGIRAGNAKCVAAAKKMEAGAMVWISSQAPWKGSPAVVGLQTICEKGVGEFRKRFKLAQGNILPTEIDPQPCSDGDSDGCECDAKNTAKVCQMALDPKRGKITFSETFRLKMFIMSGYCAWVDEKDATGDPPFFRIRKKKRQVRSIPDIFESLQPNNFVNGADYFGLNDVANKYVTSAFCGTMAKRAGGGCCSDARWAPKGLSNQHVYLGVLKDVAFPTMPADGMVSFSSCQLPGKVYQEQQPHENRPETCDSLWQWNGDHLDGTFGNLDANAANIQFLRCNIKKHKTSETTDATPQTGETEQSIVVTD